MVAKMKVKKKSLKALLKMETPKTGESRETRERDSGGEERVGQFG